MRILISNDDGIGSPGLEALYDAVASLGEVWVVAPDRERSAVSQAISLNRPLRAKRLRERWFMVDGTPVDCIYLALASLLPGDPDLVLSGINLGANLGQDVFYSGTVAAAMEAAIQGLPGVALSLDVLPLDEGEDSLSRALQNGAAFARRVAERVLEKKIPPHTLLNVNFPAQISKDGALGAEITRLGRRHYGKEVLERHDPRGKRYYWIGGARGEFADISGSDCNSIQAGKISISPLHLELSDEGLRKTLVDWEL
jgi:5'-nucleotidase